MEQKLSPRLNRVLAAVLTIMALMAGQSAFATTKTVTYTLSREKVESNDYWALTHSGDTPFDGTTTVQHQPETNHTSATFTLPDGFTFTFNWGNGATITYVSSGYFYCGNANVHFSLQWNFSNCYVTNVKVTDENGTPSSLNSSGTNNKATTDYNNVEQGNANYTLATQAAFAKLTITYADAPGLSIFESDGENAYKIKSTDDLRHLANYVNNGGNDCNGLTFRQTQDITYTPTTAWNDANSQENNYTVIGPYGSNIFFKGTFDGGGFTISGIRIYEDFGSKNHGLFGYVKGGTIKNVNLINTRITDNIQIGGIVGWNDGGAVTDCTVGSDVAIHTPQTGGSHHGGIVGVNQGTVERCISRASLTGGSSGSMNHGGIVGSNNYGTINDCLAIDVSISVPSVNNVGPIVGENNHTVSRCYYRSCTVGSTANQSNIFSVTLGSNVAMSARTASAPLPGTNYVTYTDGARLGDTQYFTEDSKVTLSYIGAPVTDTGYAAVFSVNGTPIDGSSFTMPATDVSTTVAATDVWGVTNTPAADGSSNQPYLIGSKTALDLLAKHVNGTDGHTANEFENKYFLQTADITYDGSENNYTPIGKSNRYFRGHYDGDGYSVSGININTTGNDVGLFGNVYTPGTVENVILANSTIKGFTDVGGIVGYLYGDQYDPDVSNCRVESDVTIGAGSGSAPNHGGIVGRMQCGIISGCYSAATITDNNLSNCKDFGGIVGSISGSVTEVKDCLFTGSIVTTSTKKGAIVGEKVDGSTLTNNYYTASSLGGVNGSDQDGARLARTVSLGRNVVLVGSETIYSLSGLTAIGTGNYALSYNDGTATTIYSGEGQALTLTFTGNVPEGSTVVYSIKKITDGNDVTADVLSGTTLTMPASDITISGGAYKDDYITHWQAGPDHDGSSDEKSYVITTPEGLQLLASETNGDNLFSGKYFKLGGDINMSGVNNFTPIGNSNNRFRSYFDGDGHTISHLTINLPSSDYIGLFGYMSTESTVSRVTLDRANITGKLYVGGIAGYIDNKQHVEISNCHVVSSTITSTSSTTQNGAIVGYNNEGTLTGNTYHSTLVYNTNTANGYAFNIGVGKHTINQSTINGDNEGACLDNTKLTLDAGRTDLATLLAAYNDPTGHIANNGTEPDLSNLTATVRGNVTIPSGSVLEAKTVTIAQGSHLTLADCAELVSGNTLYNVTVQKHIAPYTAGQNNGWNLICLPYQNSLRPTLICNFLPKEGYDLYRLNVTQTRWENYKLHHADNNIFFMGPDNACLYATSAEVTLEISDTVSTTTYSYKEKGTSIKLTKKKDSWNLIGNPNTFKTYVNRPYYRLNASGTALEFVANYWQEPIPVCGGILVIATSDGDTETGGDPTIDGEFCTFTRTAPEAPSVAPAGRADIPLQLSTHGAESDCVVATVITNNNDNAGVISANHGSGKTVVLEDRTLYKDGKWNTLCLPFTMTAEQIAASPLAGADIRTLSGSLFENETLTLNFTPATGEEAVTSIEAGTPYLIKWAMPSPYIAYDSDDPNPYTCSDIVSPIFTGVTIPDNYKDGSVPTQWVDFIGTTSRIEFAGDEEKTNLFLGAENKLFHGIYILNACRAYFKLKGLEAGTSSLSRGIVLNFGDGDATGISDLRIGNEESRGGQDAWYDLSGRKLNGKPTRKGLYIHHGIKYAIQ